jgi:hypothetical protein
MFLAIGRVNALRPYHHLPKLDESRHSHTQSIAATIKAIQLTPIGIVSVPTLTWTWLISRRRCPIAKMPKKTPATRNPVFGEFISRLLRLPRDLSSLIRVFYIALRRNDAACTNMPRIARPMNTSVEPVGGSTMAL